MSIEISESSGTNNPTHNQSPRTRKRAKVWEHFEQEVLVIDGVPKTQCKYCNLRLTTTKKSGTSHLINHIAESCPAIDDDSRISFLVTIRKQTREGFVFDPKRSRELMVKFFVHTEVSFNKTEDPFFEEWMESMQPTFKIVGRQTLRDGAFKLYERMKEDLRAELHTLDSRVSLTSDMWTSLQNIGYMAVTAHYISREFNMKKRIISFKELKYAHTGFAIEEAIMSCLTYWAIKSKLFTLTLDNASNNTSACQELVKNHKHALMFEGQHMHVRCCAHILNILVQDGMRIIKPTIHKLRELLKHLDSSPARMREFNSIANSMNLPSKDGFSFDTPTRWNSTYKMIGEGLMYQAVLNSYVIQHDEVAPTEPEWQKFESICAFLQAFEEATLFVSADRKPTAHKFLPLVLQIHHALRDPTWQTTDILKSLMAAMLSKFAKYWDNGFNLALVIATILDPRRKGDYLNFFYEKTYNCMSEVIENVSYDEEWLKDYYGKYKGLLRVNDEHMLSHSYEGSRSVGSPVLGQKKLEEEFALYKSRRRTAQRTKSELDTYLEEEAEVDSKNFDVLDWWKRHALKFPVLSTLAREFLTIPLSTVSSESTFSCGGRTLGDT